jgi:hypothetical protein
LPPFWGSTHLLLMNSCSSSTPGAVHCGTNAALRAMTCYKAASDLTLPSQHRFRTMSSMAYGQQLTHFLRTS